MNLFLQKTVPVDGFKYIEAWSYHGISYGISNLNTTLCTFSYFDTFHHVGYLSPVVSG